MADLPRVLTHRERDLFAPALARLQAAQAEVQAAEREIGTLIEAVAGQPGATLTVADWTLSMVEPAPPER